MKQSLLLSLATIALIIIATTAIAYAQGESVLAIDDSTSRIDEPKPREPFFRPIKKAEEVRDNIEERRAEFEEKRGEFKERFDEFRKEKIARMIEIMKARFMAAIERLRGIADRIEARIEKLDGETDKDLAQAQAYVDEAREHLNDAEDALDDIGTSTDLFTDETKAGERFGALRALFTEAKAAIKEARESLGLALKEIGFSRDNKEKPADEDQN
ncbi:MAG: hypothetical protein KBD16_01405 [Candidatus Pacebacteria bacterium]|nr:hypothetical protein [Candidatus Paceibacterota bacterium]